MSRIGKIPISIPKGLKVSLQETHVAVEGPKGKLSLPVPYGVRLEQKDGQVHVTRLSDAKQHRSNHGTVHRLLENMITGVMEGHTRELEIQGVGFRAQMQGKKLVMNLGFSHQVEYEPPQDVTVTVPKPTSIVVQGADAASVGQTAARIRQFKPPEPYKGKGIRYTGETVRRKQGKSVIK